MLFKAMIVPLILVICFGGGFVALTKPFNPKAVVVVACLLVSVVVFGYAKGLPRVFGGVGIVGSLFAIYAIRGKR